MAPWRFSMLTSPWSAESKHRTPTPGEYKQKPPSGSLSGQSGPPPPPKPSPKAKDHPGHQGMNDPSRRPVRLPLGFFSLFLFSHSVQHHGWTWNEHLVPPEASGREAASSHEIMCSWNLTKTEAKELTKPKQMCRVWKPDSRLRKGVWP